MREGEIEWEVEGERGSEGKESKEGNKVREKRTERGGVEDR